MTREVKKEDYRKGLNEDQLNAFNELEVFLQEDSKQLKCIQGFAGTGKTWLITRFIGHLSLSGRRHYQVCLTAPTNKAVGVLQDKTPKEIKRFADFSTIHKLLGVKAHITDDGLEVFTRSSLVKEIDMYNVIIVDEVSMLDDELFFGLLESTEYDPMSGKKPKKIIFMGDPKQIPPVNKIDCEPFLNPDLHGIETIHLHKIMRQAEGNMIIEASYHIRENISAKHIDFMPFHKEGQFEVINPAADNDTRIKLHNDFTALFSGEEFKQNPGMVKIVAYRNAQVNAYNNYIRTIYHGVRNPAQLIVGELIVNSRPIKSPWTSDILVTNNTEMYVEEVKDHVEEVEVKHPYDKDSVEVFNIQCYVVKVSHFDFDANKQVQKSIKVVKKEDESGLKKVLDKLSNFAKVAKNRKEAWGAFYDVKDIFAEITYAYAITAHRSQGSTYETVFVDVADICGNSNVVERNRILYTAITRASNKVVVIINK